ncbi:MAG: glycine cleavage system aminomethyltransferase GcvT [Nitrososphaerota archaeon]|jgi:aminomethyltransferase|nr:glycine cleavage system aminomethyltransferase GcvT [Nitrososphaerota archaeon]MDG6957496.1 glycine cleavage system aminomethyltransferase GcvT [Nitrososphaerota archaeon]MDG6965397.1 glycine cleavage system aminomethyltransferase GcvT [Nitrososphaerota archaeon]MDG6972775.1 glycine cleavage system aminomethyltransferase GcvT [Nitrososphaerota archaeon]MDG6976878.1 glycine cleavage system aminomethyltransferase GcvT [Nitrososphaerota archaeon]
MPKTTQLFGYHSKRAKLTEFAGYEMPLWYTTTAAEHMAVRNASGIFDVSHMGRFRVEGQKATGFLEELVPTAVKTQPPGKAFYTLLLNDRGGIIDDLIIEKLGEESYLVVVNAANAKADMEHMRAHSPSGLVIDDRTGSTAMVAVQGPGAVSSLQRLTDLDLGQLKRFRCAEARVAGEEALVSRTGYTGEDGFEVIVYGATSERPDGAMKVWEKLAETSTPCGLGARDSLRLEAGFPLHGSDMDQGTNPYEADLAWVIAAGKRGFVGSEALEASGAQPPSKVRRGLVLDFGIPRHGFEVLGDAGAAGVVTSGTFSPVLRKGIALCYLAQGSSEPGSRVGVTIRGSSQPASVTKPPFYDERSYGWKRQKDN